MPTGYTHKVSDGTVTEFEPFLLECARAFGACIMQRDDPVHEPPKLQEVDQYHKNECEKAKRKLTSLKKMTVEDASKKATEEFHKRVVENDKAKMARDDVRRRYVAMLAKARAWNPPTDDHKNLKNFMIDQLNESIKFDCLPDSYFKAPVLQTGKKWLADQISSAEYDIWYHAQKYEEEVARTNDHNKWIADLYNTIK